MHKVIGVAARPAKIIHLILAEVAHNDLHQCLKYPVGMCGTAGDIDHRQAGPGPEGRAKQSTLFFAFVLQAARLDEVVAPCGDTTIGGTSADSDHMLCLSCQVIQPVFHSPTGTGELVETAAVVRPPNHRSLKAEQIQGNIATTDRLQHLYHFGA